MNNKSRLIRGLGIAVCLGGVMAVLLIFAFSQTEWGAPGSAAYQTYELLNRLMTGALLLISVGWLGLLFVWPGGYGRWGAALAFIGSLVMVIGVSAEFWLFSDLSYAGSTMRQVAYSTFSIGSLLLDIGAMVAGAAAWRSRIWPRWSALILLLTLPLDLAAFFWLDSVFLASTVLALVVGLNLNFTKQFPAQARTDVP